MLALRPTNIDFTNKRIFAATVHDMPLPVQRMGHTVLVPVSVRLIMSPIGVHNWPAILPAESIAVLDIHGEKTNKTKY